MEYFTKINNGEISKKNGYNWKKIWICERVVWLRFEMNYYFDHQIKNEKF